MEVASIFTAPTSSQFKFRARCSRQNSDSSPSRRLAREIMWHQKGLASGGGKDVYANLALEIRKLGRERLPHLAQQLWVEMNSEGFVPCYKTLSALMLCYADNGLFSHAQALWDEIINSSYVPNIEVVSELMEAYGKMGHFDEVSRILREVTSRDFKLCPRVYSCAISCFGNGGQLELMENTLKEMVSNDFPVDSATGNAFLLYYSEFGSLLEMEAAYGCFKRSGFSIEEEGIRAVTSAYIKEGKFYRLGEFLRGVGLGRKNVGNLLWNFLLLSYAANFKMKSMQREFLSMLEAGFSPDLTTFNIRALAFSRMALFWDLHVSLEHMKHDRVVPDLVTYGCVVDAFLDRKVGRNLDFALTRMNVDDSPIVATDKLVFNVLGKGDFHSSSEAFLESDRQQKWTYRKLISVYLKKKYRSNQIFWNY
ncbi:hypothetical protein Sjap_023090 [Stephania japonica]|uniref:Pentatricopeptide repeat-containing protein n=1 Tax=Stephania japonica TaxID=461633 RepID=A0AAP0EVS7_9MAGN